MKHLFLFMIPALATLLTAGCGQKSRMVTGSFSESGEKGINVYDFDAGKGTLGLVSSFNAGPNPSYLCVYHEKKLIYAINEVSEFMGVKGGGVTTIRYENEFDNLVKAGELPVPTGGPCYISLSPSRKYLLVANYGGGSVAVVRLGESGIPEKVTDTIIYNDTIRHAGKEKKISHAHMIDFDPQGEKVYVTDLGLDRIMTYTLDEVSGRLTPLSESGTSMAPYMGPRHFVFNKAGTMMYVMGELNSAVAVLRVDKVKGLVFLQMVPSVGKDFTGKNYSADIHIGKSGKFLYATNRGENTVSAFSIGKDGLLAHKGNTSCGGSWPRNFAVDPAGKFIIVGNQRSDKISVFRIDPSTGLPSENTQNTEIPSPACIKF